MPSKRNLNRQRTKSGLTAQTAAPGATSTTSDTPPTTVSPAITTPNSTTAAGAAAEYVSSQDVELTAPIPTTSQPPITFLDTTTSTIKPSTSSSRKKKGTANTVRGFQPPGSASSAESPTHKQQASLIKPPPSPFASSNISRASPSFSFTTPKLPMTPLATSNLPRSSTSTAAQSPSLLSVLPTLTISSTSQNHSSGPPSPLSLTPSTAAQLDSGLMTASMISLDGSQVYGGTEDDPTVSLRIRDFDAAEDDLATTGEETTSFTLAHESLTDISDRDLEDAAALLDEVLVTRKNSFHDDHVVHGPEVSVRKNSFRDVTAEERAEVFGIPSNLADASPQLLPTTTTTTIAFASSPTAAAAASSVTSAHGGKKRVGVDDFDLLKVIGKGAYGKVFLVKRKHTTKLYAMKVLRKATLIVHTKTVEHTANERSILERIQHPFIVRLWYAFQTPAKLFLILEYAPGGELFSHLANERMFSEDVAAFYIGELLLAVDHLHSLGIIYRDLKPENVLLDAHGHVLLTDFGLSKVALTTQTICGTIEFTAPEVLDDKTTYSYGVDHWSLGIMLYDMLTGSPPFTGQNRKKVMEAIISKKPTFPTYLSSYARDLLTRLLRKDPSKRIGAGPTRAVEVQQHGFFRKIIWQRLEKKQCDPPIVPMLDDVLDTRNFDEVFTGERVTLESPPPVRSNLGASVNSNNTAPDSPGPGGKNKKKKKKAAAATAAAATAATTNEESSKDGFLETLKLEPPVFQRVATPDIPTTPKSQLTAKLAGSIKGSPSPAMSPSMTPLLNGSTTPVISLENPVTTSSAGLSLAGLMEPRNGSDILVVMDEESGATHFQGFSFVAADDDHHNWGNRHN